MRTRRILGRLVLAAIGATLPALAADAWIRRQVGRCGVTPFQTSTVDGLPHLLFPGRSTVYKGVEVRINAQGFRGADFAPPTAGHERIALIGDSVTFGNGCPEEGTLAVKLTTELAARGKPAQVLNCGIPGYNADNVAVLLRERVVPLRPQRIVWVMVANDVNTSLNRSEIPDDAIIDSFAEFPLGSPLLQMLNQNASGLLRQAGVQLDGYVESILRESRRADGKRLRQALTGMQAICRAAGIDFRVAIYPFMTCPATNPFAPVEEGCARLCAELAIPSVRLSDAFPRDENLTRYWVGPVDGHPNGDANRIAAGLLATRYFSD
ncbi:MAG: SGNH/GDSL hydrolase family protein [Planctomycetes bacterium]|nr:SGNH/GDSL hydrolase family protein [Planctomycetota bacterium]